MEMLRGRGRNQDSRVVGVVSKAVKIADEGRIGGITGIREAC